MSDDLIERLEALHVWPQFVADSYADVLLPRQIQGLYSVGAIATESAATIRDLRAKLDEAREIMRAVFYKLDDQPNAPGHGHLIAGVWDDNASNGDLAGKPCDWCATWERFTTLARIGDA